MTDSVCFIGYFPVPTGLSTRCISTDLEDHAAFPNDLAARSRSICGGPSNRLVVPALGRSLTASRYAGVEDLTYPFHDHTILVTHCGRMSFKSQNVNRCDGFAGQRSAPRRWTNPSGS